MDEQCFNCDAPASKRCTVVLDAGPDLEAKPTCEACYTFFCESQTIEIRVDSPAVETAEPTGGG